MAPMTDRLQSGHECEWSRYTKKQRSAVLTAIQALSSHYEVPQELPRKMLALLMPQCEPVVKSNAALDSPAVATI
jgi:hypothetical protein